MSATPPSPSMQEIEDAELVERTARGDRAQLVSLLRALSPQDAEIVLLRFHDELTQDVIARRVGVSQMHVSRVLRRSLVRMRNAAT